MAVTYSMGDNNTTSERCALAAADGQTNGRRAEALAARFLERHGLTVLARNVRCRGGELDLVCRDSQTLVFIEVRLRRHAAYGGAAASVTSDKQQRVILAARHYLARHRQGDCACRFDCVLLDGEKIEWVRDAFSAD
jgi:putative endonuclease